MAMTSTAAFSRKENFYKDYRHKIDCDCYECYSAWMQQFMNGFPVSMIIDDDHAETIPDLSEDEIPTIPNRTPSFLVSRDEE